MREGEMGTLGSHLGARSFLQLLVKGLETSTQTALYNALRPTWDQGSHFVKWDWGTVISMEQDFNELQLVDFTDLQGVEGCCFLALL